MRNRNAYRRDHLFLPQQKLLDFASRHETPFFLYDESGILKSAGLVNAAFADRAGHRQFYPIRANCNAAVLRLLHRAGSGVVACSLPELLLAERCGFAGEEILYHSTVLTDTALQEAARIGCALTLDTYSDVIRLMKSRYSPPFVGLQYNPDEKMKSGWTVLANPRISKTGMSRIQIYAAIAMLEHAGIERIGLHGNYGSNIQDDRFYPTVARTMFQFAVDVLHETGRPMLFCNLGGGVGLNYILHTPLQNLPHIAKQIRLLREQILTPEGLDMIQLHTELGRYVTGKHGILVSRALDVKQRERTFVILDASTEQLMRPALAHAYQHISVVGTRSIKNRVPYSVHGCTVNPMDRFAERIVLPKVKAGTLVAIHDTGAYGQSMRRTYCGVLRCAEYLYHSDGTFEQIRRAQTVESFLDGME